MVRTSEGNEEKDSDSRAALLFQDVLKTQRDHKKGSFLGGGGGATTAINGSGRPGRLAACS